MRIAGIIAEYNPFHQGHAYHIAQTRRLSACGWVVAVMDGHFTQRGEPTCLDKWTRVQMALLCGVDAVFELPALFAVRTADVFALGGVFILSSLGADILSFGCEPAGISLLDAMTELSLAEPDAVQQKIRRNLQDGKSHARARGEAYADFLHLSPDAINRPNTILALEYRKALRTLHSSMEALAVPRLGDYHDDSLEQGIASASAIREAIRSGRGAEALRHIPQAARPLLQNACKSHAPDDLLLHRLRSMQPEDIAALPDAPEGIEMRVKRCAETADSWQNLIDQVKCRRYTRARITRLCAHALMGMKGDLAASHPLPHYARLLGMRRDAAPLLRELSRRSTIPIVSDAVTMRDDPVFALECRATDIWALTREAPSERRANQEFTRKFVGI